jgi:hypothetical protein
MLFSARRDMTWLVVTFLSNFGTHPPNNPEDSNPYIHCRYNIKYYFGYISLFRKNYLVSQFGKKIFFK